MYVCMCIYIYIYIYMCINKIYINRSRQASKDPNVKAEIGQAPRG